MRISPMSAQGQTRKIRACLLQVRFTPLSERLLRRVSTSALGHERKCRPSGCLPTHSLEAFGIATSPFRAIAAYRTFDDPES